MRNLHVGIRSRQHIQHPSPPPPPPTTTPCTPAPVTARPAGRRLHVRTRAPSAETDRHSFWPQQPDQDGAGRDAIGRARGPVCLRWPAVSRESDTAREGASGAPRDSRPGVGDDGYRRQKADWHASSSSGAGRVLAILGEARLISARLGETGQGEMRLDSARPGEAHLGEARRGASRRDPPERGAVEIRADLGWPVRRPEWSVLKWRGHSTATEEWRQETVWRHSLVGLTSYAEMTKWRDCPTPYKTCTSARFSHNIFEILIFYILNILYRSTFELK